MVLFYRKPDMLEFRASTYREIWIGHNGASKQTANPYVFPLLHPALKYLPPVYQAVCGADPVRDDSVVLKHVLDKYKWVFP